MCVALNVYIMFVYAVHVVLVYLSTAVLVTSIVGHMCVTLNVYIMFVYAVHVVLVYAVGSTCAQHVLVHNMYLCMQHMCLTCTCACIFHSYYWQYMYSSSKDLGT